MGWNLGAPEPDVAEYSSRRRVPRWVWRTAIAVLGAGLLVLFVLLRLGPDVTATTQEVRFVQRHQTEVDVSIANPTGDPLFVGVTTPHRPGLRLERVTGETEPLPRTPPEFVVPPRGEAVLTLLWEPTDCVRALTDPGQAAWISLSVGELAGVRESLDHRLASWGELVPPACDDSPRRGVPRLADLDTGLVSDRVIVRLMVDNLGGQPLEPTGVTVGTNPKGEPSENGGAPLDELVTKFRPGSRSIGIGEASALTLVFRASDCRAPVDGPAAVTLEFITPTTGRPEHLTVELADSWPNLLGTCTGPS